MSQPYLYLRNRSTVNSQVAAFKEINRQLVQIGSDFGTDESALYPYHVSFNKIAHWNNDLYALNINTIYKYDVVSGSGWQPLFTFSTPNSSANNHRLGFITASINGSGVLVCGYPSTGGNNSAVRIVKIFQDGSVVEGPVRNTSSNINRTLTTRFRGFWTPMAHRNSIYWSDNPLVTNLGDMAFGVYDLESDSYVPISTSENLAWATCVHRDKVFAIAPTLEGFIYNGKVNIYRIDGTSASFIDQLPEPAGHPNFSNEHGPCLVSFKGELYAFAIYNRAPDGWKCWKINLDENNNFVSREDLTSTVIPSELRNGGSRYHRGQAMYPRIDLVTDPQNPTIEFDVWNDGSNGTGGDVTPVEGEVVHLYKWVNAPTGQLTFVDAGLDSFRFCRMFTVNGGGGERIWSGSGTLNTSAPVLSLNGANIDCEFEVFGGPGGTGVALQILYDKEGELVDNIGSLVSVGGSAPNAWVSGNTVVGLSAGDRPIVTWAAAINGIEPGDNPRVGARVFLL